MTQKGVFIISNEIPSSQLLAWCLIQVNLPYGENHTVEATVGDTTLIYESGK